jgi:phage repressor protein C with HTH and peptisase S24 domain
MEPLIADGARVVLNLRDTRLREGIFGFRTGDELRMKRLRRLADGVEILSENPRYEPERLIGPDLEHFQIIGKAMLGVTVL